MNLKEWNNKKLLSMILVMVIIVASTIALVTTYGMQTIGRQPSVKIFADATRGPAPFNVSFSSLVTNYRGELEYEWNFRDGEISMEKEPSVIFYEEGEYICILNVTDKRGNTYSDSIRIIVTRNRPPNVELLINHHALERQHNSFSWLSRTPRYKSAGDRQRYLDNIIKNEGTDAWGEGRIVVTSHIDDPEGDEIVSYDWSIQTVEKTVCRKGEIVHPKYKLQGEETVRIPELYTWMTMDHMVTLTVTDSAGNQANATIQFEVNPSVQQLMMEHRLGNLKNIVLWVFATIGFIGTSHYILNNVIQ
jgi:hypothetical protein